MINEDVLNRRIEVLTELAEIVHEALAGIKDTLDTVLGDMAACVEELDTLNVIEEQGPENL